MIILVAITVAMKGSFYFLSSLLALLVGTLLSFFAGLGFGDVKLLAILSLFFLPADLEELSQFIAGISFSSGLLIAITLFRGGNSKDPMAFAPCIFAGAILCASLG